MEQTKNLTEREKIIYALHKLEETAETEKRMKELNQIKQVLIEKEELEKRKNNDE